MIVMVSGPRSYGSANQNSVLVSCHCVFHVGGHKQEATYRIGLKVGRVGTEAYLFLAPVRINRGF